MGFSSAQIDQQMEEAFGPHLLSLQYKRPVDSDQSAASREAKTAKGVAGKGSGSAQDAKGKGKAQGRGRGSRNQGKNKPGGSGWGSGSGFWTQQQTQSRQQDQDVLRSRCPDVPPDGQGDCGSGGHDRGLAPVDCVGDVDADNAAFVSPHTVCDSGALEGEGVTEWSERVSGVEWSGVEWRGVAWRGVAWSGVELELELELEWSGVEWSGVE
eukprot:s1559_g9.t1